jgi:beta-phosphoglucomutase family hydrolase
MIDISEYEAFIFDMDGVIVDSENLYTEIEQNLFLQLNLNISHEEHITYQGTSNVMMWTRIKEKHGISKTLKECVDLTNQTVQSHFDSLESIAPMDGVERLLSELRQRGVKLAVASSSTIEIINLILEKTGLRKYFPIVVDSLMAGAGKPDPAIFLMAAKLLGIQPEHCVVVEDSSNGIKAALAAGMFCVAYNGPGSEYQDQSAANVIIKDFSELIV